MSVIAANKREGTRTGTQELCIIWKMKSFLSGVLALSLVGGAFAAKRLAYPEHLSADKGGEIIKASIEALGGWDNWKSKRNVRYERDNTRYEADGKVIHEVQFHKLRLPPEVKVRQESLRDGKRIVTGFDGSNAWVTEDGKSITEEKRLSGARNSSFGTQYMLCVPFKLADPGTLHESLGPIKLTNGTYDKVKVDLQGRNRRQPQPHLDLLFQSENSFHGAPGLEQRREHQSQHQRI